MHVPLNGTERLLHQEEHGVDEGKVTLARESLVIDAVLVAEPLVLKSLTGLGEDWIDPPIPGLGLGASAFWGHLAFHFQKGTRVQAHATSTRRWRNCRSSGYR